MTKCPETILYVDVAMLTVFAIVVNATSAPRLVPVLLEATIRKWYVVPGARFAIPALTGRPPVSASARWFGDLEP